MTQDQAINKVLDLAESEIGYHEQGTNWTKYAAEMDSYAGYYNGPKDGYAWCDVFVDWLFVKCFGVDIGREMVCQPLNSLGAGCLYSAQYYKQAGRYFLTPQPGDQIFFSYSAGEVSHTGIVQKVTGGVVYTIEGNSSDMVANKCYSVSSNFIVGYGRPRWDLAANLKESNEPPAPEPAKPQGPSYTVTLPLLQRGDNGTPVERLQMLLIARGYNCGGRIAGGREIPDGDFGPSTEKAVKAVQRNAEITDDGIVGSDTMRVLLTT